MHQILWQRSPLRETRETQRYTRKATNAIIGSQLLYTTTIHFVRKKCHFPNVCRLPLISYVTKEIKLIVM
jgi:hypothetical protein